MEDLHFNRRADFTRWVVETQLLREPFVLVDVGVFNGENPRWHVLGDYLVVHGFDAIETEVERLKKQAAGDPRLHYHWMALGNENGEREFRINTANPTSSSLYVQGIDRSFSYAARKENVVRVPIRRLDTLLADGIIPPADFLKVDVEGFEKDVFAGATELLRSDVLGVETETNFNASPTYPAGHFATLQQMLFEHHLLVCDLAYNRVPRTTFQEALARGGKPLVKDTESVGRISTINALFMRDIVDEAERPQNYRCLPRAVTVDKMIKAMMIYELHGLNDIAVDIAARFRDDLAPRMDVEHATSLLADPDCRMSDGSEIAVLRNLVRLMQNSMSWRLTAPLRFLRNLVRC